MQFATVLNIMQLMHNIPTKLNARALLVFKNQIGSELVVVLANYLLLDLNPGLSFC